MSDDRDNEQKAVVWAVLIGSIVLAVGLALGVGIQKTLHKTVPVAALPAAVAAVPIELAADQNAVRVENGVVKFYFASGQSEVAAGAQEALAEAVKAASEGKTLTISGFHDSTGSLALNQQLAKARAMAVSATLQAMGVAPAQMVLKKPESALGTGAGSDAAARRVEVTLQ